MKVFEKIESYYGPYPIPYSEEDAVLVHKDLNKIASDLAEIRDSKEKTETYFKGTILKYKSDYLGGWEELVLALLKVLEEDILSFSYVYYYLTDWVQGLYNIPLHVCPTQKEIKYAIDFDLDEIEERVKSADSPSSVIKELLDQSRSIISLDYLYKKEVEEKLSYLLDCYSSSTRPKSNPIVCEFLVTQENAEEDMRKLHSLFDGRRGKDLAIAVCAAINAGIISKSPSFSKLKSYFDVQGGHSGYEQYQNGFLDPYRMDMKDRASYKAYLELLEEQ